MGMCRLLRMSGTLCGLRLHFFRYNSLCICCLDRLAVTYLRQNEQTLGTLLQDVFSLSFETSHGYRNNLLFQPPKHLLPCLPGSSTRLGHLMGHETYLLLIRCYMSRTL